FLPLHYGLSTETRDINIIVRLNTTLHILYIYLRMRFFREEWARRPAPGEQKRLALRWKVREYMLRQDLARQVARYTAHPKEWSPKPYLD
ncbi:unnamed protein product, partial [Angiostrongylus costaricensis]|uniref:HYLS1_C domain-containing protein n=1 Tax=Angiostrongylus costaricensis TaxID=334426 RepID=A0A0R3PN22_ANGCS